MSADIAVATQRMCSIARAGFMPDIPDQTKETRLRDS